MLRPRSAKARPVSKSRGQGFLALVGLGGLAVAGLLGWVGFNAPNSIPGRSYYTVRAELDEADNLTPHYQVRIRGQLVGQVLKPRVRNGKAVVDLQLEGKLKPLKSDTTIRVRPRSPIGVRFVDLEPGTKGTPLADGAMIPASQTSASTTLDTVLGTFDEPTRKKTQELLAGLGGGFAGRGEDLNVALGKSTDFLRRTRRVTQAIADTPGATQRFVQGGATAAGAADPVRDVIATGFRPEAEASRAFGDSRAEIAALLTTAPESLAGTRRGLEASSPVVVELGRLAAGLQPLLRVAPSSLRQTSLLLAQARPATRRLDATLKLAQRAVAPSLDLLKAVKPVLPGLEEALGAPRPILADLAPRRCDVVQMTRNWESMLAWGQDGGNYLRFNVVGSPESVSGTPTQGETIRDNPYPAPCAKTKEGPR